MLEALAALALSGLVLASVPLASGILIRTWQKVTAGSDRLDMVATGLSAIRQELSTIQRERFAGRGGGPYAFVGTPDTVGVVLADAGGPGPKGESIVMLTVRPETDGNTLLRGSAPFRHDSRGFENIQLQDPVVLLSGPWKYLFTYAEHSRGKLQWRTEWQDEEELPVAIRLDVVDFVTETRVIPPLIVPLRIEADPGCIDGAGECGI